MNSKRVSLQVTCLSSPVGWLALAASPDGLFALRICGKTQPTENQLEWMLRQISSRKVLDITFSRSSRWLIDAQAWLEDYFSRLMRPVTLKLDLSSGTPFQRKVWKILCQIPWGQTRSYKEIAELLGNPRAARAVGQACARNPIAIIVPCHRVIAHGGDLGGYSGGIETKRLLTEFEKITDSLDLSCFWSYGANRAIRS